MCLRVHFYPSQVCFEPLTPAAAECCDCHQLQIPGVASFLLLPENQAEYVRNQRHWQALACAAQMVARGVPVRHAPAAAGATVRYRNLQWSQNQRSSQSTTQMKSSAAHPHLPPPVQPQPSQQLGFLVCLTPTPRPPLELASWLYV
jgi:hypothetical protein